MCLQWVIEDNSPKGYQLTFLFLKKKKEEEEGRVLLLLQSCASPSVML